VLPFARHAAALLTLDRSTLPYWETAFAGGARAWVPPIAPAPEDLAHVERRITAHGVAAPRALLLGVTRGLADLRWPAGTSLAALDWSWQMIAQIWRSAPAPAFASAVRGDWREMPLAGASLDIAVGDGCYFVLGSVEGASLMNAELLRTLRPGGLYCQRCFVRPDRLGIDQVLEQLRAGRFPDPFIFRWMFMMAAQQDSVRGVTLDEIWQAWQAHEVDARPEIDRRGWRADTDWGFGRFRGGKLRYLYPRRDELTALVAPHFDLVEYRVPAYPRGACFPSLVMRPRG
jgi:SAM-dependent methyltransferase